MSMLLSPSTGRYYSVPTVVQDLLGTLRLSCTKCHMTTTAAQYRLHKNSQCQGHYDISSPSQATAQHRHSSEVNCDTNSTCRIKVAEHLVRWLTSGE